MGDTRQRADGLLDAPRVQAVPAPQVDEPIHARGNVNVRARALVASGEGLSQEAPLDGSILGGHDLSWGSASWHFTAQLVKTRRSPPGAAYSRERDETVDVSASACSTAS
jgi:hypothetical protein